jgi:hypothetical protein
MDTSYTVIIRNPQGAITGTIVYPTRREAAESLVMYSQKKVAITRDKDKRTYTVRS